MQAFAAEGLNMNMNMNPESVWLVLPYDWFYTCKGNRRMLQTTVPFPPSHLILLMVELGLMVVVVWKKRLGQPNSRPLFRGHHQDQSFWNNRQNKVLSSPFEQGEDLARRPLVWPPIHLTVHAKRMFRENSPIHFQYRRINKYSKEGAKPLSLAEIMLTDNN